eukprot:168949-Prorocentrum_minimum.AAC.1
MSLWGIKPPAGYNHQLLVFDIKWVFEFGGAALACPLPGPAPQRPRGLHMKLRAVDSSLCCWPCQHWLKPSAAAPPRPPGLQMQPHAAWSTQ